MVKVAKSLTESESEGIGRVWKDEGEEEEMISDASRPGLRETRSELTDNPEKHSKSDSHHHREFQTDPESWFDVAVKEDGELLLNRKGFGKGEDGHRGQRRFRRGIGPKMSVTYPGLLKVREEER